MLNRLLVAAFFAVSAPSVAVAEAPGVAEASVPALAQALRLDDLFGVFKDEGLGHGDQLEADMFPDGGGPRWRDAVAAIYDLPVLRRRFDAALQTQLGQDPQVLADIIAFYSSDLGTRIVGLEIEARRAFLDVAQEEAARVAAEDRIAARDPKVKLLDRFILAGDLVESNVAGALSGNMAFMTGMVEAGAYPGLGIEDLMTDVWGQEEQTRADLTSWLQAYLGLAYEPLSEAELQSYVEFMESPAGQRLNAALFVAFDQVFRQVSQDLGRAAGVAMQGRNI